MISVHISGSSVFLVAAGLKPKTAVAERLSAMCILPLLLAGVLGSPSKYGQLTKYLRNLLVQSAMQEGQPTRHTADIVNPVRFLWLVFCEISFRKLSSWLV